MAADADVVVEVGAGPDVFGEVSPSVSPCRQSNQCWRDEVLQASTGRQGTGPSCLGAADQGRDDFGGKPHQRKATAGVGRPTDEVEPGER